MSEKHNSSKVAIVIGQLAQGGSERQLYTFLKHCDRERWSPIVYVSRGPMGFWEEPIRELDIPIILLQGNPLKRMWQFRQTCQAHQVRRFFSWSSHTNAYALALVGLNIPCIGSFRNDFHFDFPKRHRRLRVWASVAGISIAVCNSQETTLAVRSRAASSKRVVHVPNGVPLVEDAISHRREWRQRLNIRDDECLVLGVGRLSAQKNFARFVEAIAHTWRVVPVRAVVAGRDDGSLESLQRQARDLAVDPDVLRFIGPVPEARELMCAADVFLLSSDYEGMPNVVLEAMAAGVPCVCTRVNGVSDLIEPGVHGFITDHDAVALAQKVSLLAQDKVMRQEMGTRAIERVKNTFDPKLIAGRLWQLLE
jgi:glycosyltransferase involved in cell wall biosynthesis